MFDRNDPTHRQAMASFLPRLVNPMMFFQNPMAWNLFRQHSLGTALEVEDIQKMWHPKMLFDSQYRFFKQDHRDKLELMKAAYIEQGNLRTLKERLSFEVASKSFSPDYSGLRANGSVDIEALSMLDIFDGQLPDDMYDAFSHSHVPCGSIAVHNCKYVDARLLKLKI